MSDELMACLVIRWLAGVLGPVQSLAAWFDPALQPTIVDSEPSIPLKINPI
jgi:hypothetical protein